MEGIRNSQQVRGVGVGGADFEAAIVGGGISGICIAIKLIEAGITNIVIVEKSAGFGGTWRDNRYPGCRCDVPAHLYSYSFAGNPEWTRVYPDQTEILTYLTSIAEKYNLYRYIRFSNEVQNATWDPKESKWTATVQILSNKDAEYDDSYTFTTDYLISAVGQLNNPFTPDIPGRETFKGKIVHSARWSSTSNLKNSRVGIIGNGATAIQIVPEIAKLTSHLTLFQRTPNWVMPRADEEYSGWIRFVLRNTPVARSLYRAYLMQQGESFWAPLTQIGTDASERLRQWCLGHMHSQLPGREDLWRKLTPQYTPGCKRILISNDFYPSLLEDNVDVESVQIERIIENGVRLVDGREIGLDYLILATGFQTNTFLSSLSIQCLGSESLQTKWKNGAYALYGVGIENTPNFGMLYGSNTNLAHNSIILMIEAQARYIQVLVSRVVQQRRKGCRLVITPKPDRVRNFNAEIQKQLSKTSFADPQCHGWYKAENGTVTNNWGGSVVGYQEVLSVVEWSDYEITGDGAKSFSGPTEVIGRVLEEKMVKSSWPLLAVGAIGLAALATLFT